MAPGLAAEAEIKGYGVSLKIPLPKWAVTALAAVIVVGLIGLGAYLATTYVGNREFVSKDVLNVYKEADKHSREASDQRDETPVSFADGTKVTVFHHRSDGCDQIVRHIPTRQRTDGLWIFGPELTPEKQRSSSETPNVRDLVVRASLFPEVTLSAAGASTEGAGQCRDPHPGRFREESQPAGRCATKVFRYFEDGCSHYQLFNPCAGTWDVYPNGAPRVTGQRCIH